MISAKIKAAEFKMSIFAMIIIYNQHIIIHVISAKIETAEFKMLIFVMIIIHD